MFRVLWLLGWNGSRGRRYRSNQRSTHLYLNNIMFGQQDCVHVQQNISSKTLKIQRDRDGRLLTKGKVLSEVPLTNF
ncbi:hypothetical protein GLOIN_2v1583737, partial [Rhizophagus irregularis DAOM 181602=DAOM 197198]